MGGKAAGICAFYAFPKSPGADANNAKGNTEFTLFNIEAFRGAAFHKFKHQINPKPRL